MTMKHKLLALLAVALLLVGMLPMGALAAPLVVDTEVMAEIYESDTHCEVDMDASLALDGHYSWDQLLSFHYDWPLKETGRFVDYGTWGYYTCTQAEAGNLTTYCDVYDQNNQMVAKVNFKVTDTIYAPVTPDVPWAQYVYYDPGDTVTFSLPAATIGGNEQLQYSWGLYGENVDRALTADGTTSYTLKLDETMHMATVSCSVQTRGYTNYKFMGDFILMMNASNPIKIPTPSGSTQAYRLAPGESHTFTVPAATPGDPSKTLEYRWYKFDQNDVLKPYQTTTVPQLTVTNTPDKYDTMEEFRCYVGYQGDPEDFYYGMSIEAYYLSTTPSVPSAPAAPSAPHTGDNTPLTALFLLLGLSLAGATLLPGMRRKQS